MDSELRHQVSACGDLQIRVDLILRACPQNRRASAGREPSGPSGGWADMNQVPKGPPTWRVIRSVWRASRVRRPKPVGAGTFNHQLLAPILCTVAESGLAGATRVRTELTAYRQSLHTTDPDGLSHADALAFWINLYNAEVLEAALEARDAHLDSLIRVQDVFDRPRGEISGEMLSLDDIEHGKIRRFGDPRVHAVLTCGSVSCPTLPARPLVGDGLDDQLDAAMVNFLHEGGATLDRESNEVRLSRIFLWYGADFVHPASMPRWRPVTRRSVTLSLEAWMSPEDATWVREARPRTRFQPYDWGLSCRVAQSPGSSTRSAGMDTRITPLNSPTA